jgi:hypothetical protein
MKNSLVGFFLLLSTPIFAQLTVTEQFQKIGTVQEAQQYIDANPALNPFYSIFHSEKTHLSTRGYYDKTKVMSFPSAMLPIR